MNNIKAILIILATLIVGYVLGFLSNGRLHHHRMRAFLEYRTEEGFRRVALNVLSPNKDQLQLVGPIIDEYAQLNRDLNMSYRRDLEAMQISYFNDLEPYLTQLQLDRLVGETRESQPQPPHKPQFKKQKPDSLITQKSKPSQRERQGLHAKDSLNAQVGHRNDSDTNLISSNVPPPMDRGGHMGPPATPEEKAERFSFMMRRQLFLDEKQYQTVRQINLDHALKMKSIHEQYKGVDYRTMMLEISALEEERNEKFKAVLSPSQYEQYLVVMARLKKAWVHKRGRR